MSVSSEDIRVLVLSDSGLDGALGAPCSKAGCAQSAMLE